MAKYRVTSKMPQNAEGFKAGDIIEYDPETAALSLAKGYIEPLDMAEVEQNTQLRTYRRKEK